ncbi:hypothetical protein GN244_ATG02166 [Phytophthora infestans]|nr:hypothetical protein GN244_ATG02166 [Phytophthora infestans]
MATLQEVQDAQREHVVRLQHALEQMHKRSAKVNAAVRAAGRKGRDKKQGTAMAQFDVGDYVLYADVWQHTRSQRKEAHASRLKFYADDSINFSEDLLLHIAHNSEGHVVDKLLEARYSRQDKRHEPRVHWRGLDTIEISWEPAATLMQDVPAAVKAFVQSHGMLPAVKELKKALRIN